MEIITGTERRRRWRDEDKLRIVAEAEAPDAVFALVARRHDISRGQLWKWRGQVRRGELARVPVEPEFIPVRMMASAVSRITLFDGRPVAKFDGLPGSTSRVL